jgi:hypothetical protein
LDIFVKGVKGKKDLKAFVKFPFGLYRNCRQWVPPLFFDELNVLNPEKNPASEYCESKLWLAYKDGKIAGRIAGIINHKYIEKWNKKAVRFGWIDFIDDEEVSKALIDTVIKWASEKDIDCIHGPLGFTDLDYEGMLIQGFNEVGTMATIYNYEYYPRHLEKFGFEKEADWLEFEITVPDKIPEKADRIASIVKERTGIRVLDAGKSKDFLPYGKQVFELINNSYKDLFGFVPLSEKQIEKYIKQYFGFIVPDFVKLLLDKENNVAGFVIGMPSLTKALVKAKGRLFPFGIFHLLKAIKFKNKYVDLYLGAIRPDLQGKGADALLMTEFTRSCIKNKIISAESNIELETNVQVQGHWKYFNSRQHKRRRCYIKKIR